MTHFGPEQVQGTQRQRTAEAEGAEVSALPDWPTPAEDVLRQGVAQIDTNEGSGEYTVTEQIWDQDAGPAAWVDGVKPLAHVAATARDRDNRAAGNVDEYVPFWEVRRADGQVEILIDVTAANHLFFVLVWKDGGVVGDEDNQCTATYTVRTLDATGPAADGVLLGSAKSPGKRRPPVGPMDCPAAAGAGVRGRGYYDSAVAFHLWDANECIDSEKCPSS